MPKNTFLEIVTPYDDILGAPHLIPYRESIFNVIKKLLPKEVFLDEEASDDERKEAMRTIQKLVPVMCASKIEKTPFTLSFSVLSSYRSNSFKFFFELITNWLVPGKRLNLVTIFAADFSISECESQLFTLCEMMLHIDNEEDLHVILQNLPIIESEVMLGMPSAYYARRILESRGLSLSEKAASIHEYIAAVIDKLPSYYHKDLFSDMQHFLVTCKDAFLSSRSVRHISRLICSQYLIRKKIHQDMTKNEKKRHLKLHIFKSLVDGRHVLSVMVGLNFLQEKEIFEKEHLFNALCNYLPNISFVKGSLMCQQRGSEKLSILYLEIEKDDFEDFTQDELAKLRRSLPADLEDRIERVMHPVFMPRNEEDVMRNIIQLGQQINSVRDIPQVFISFDEQLQKHILFTVIVVRLVKKECPSIASLFASADGTMEYIHDRKKTIGYVRKRHAKEATVFRIKMKKDIFMRRDHVVDLYRARHILVQKLRDVLGEFRDYNGGMITKQNELFLDVRAALGDDIGMNDLLLEKFFHSICPVVMRTVLDPLAIKQLFLMLVDALDDSSQMQDPCEARMKEEGGRLYFIFSTEQQEIMDHLLVFLRDAEVGKVTLAHSCINLYGMSYLGCIYQPHCTNEIEAFKSQLISLLDQVSVAANLA